MKEKLGFNVSINKTSTQTLKTFTEETNARAKRMLDTVIVPYALHLEKVKVILIQA